MRTYEQVLRGTKAFLQGAPHKARNEFHVYINTLQLTEQFPGIQGIGISEIIPHARLTSHIAEVRQEGFPNYTVWPPGERDILTSITQIEPFDERNQRAFGFDMYSQPVRRTAMAQARDSGRAALSGKITLVQESGTGIQPGFLMYLAVYRAGMDTHTVEQRRNSIVGWVYAPFRIADFLQGLGGERSSDLTIRIYDGPVKSEAACLYGCTSANSTPALMHVTESIHIAGRPWLLEIQSSPALERRLSTTAPELIALSGVVVAALLSLLAWSLATRRARATDLAETMTRELKASHDRLEVEQDRMKVILENSHEAFIAIDEQGVITDWNRQAERTFGWTAAQAIGRNLAKTIIPEDQRDAHNAGFQRFLKTGTGPVINRRIEVSALHRNGTVVPIELAIAAVRSENGYTANAFIRDLTQRKLAEAHEAERQKTLDETRQALQQAQKMEAVGKLTGGVAHDFNNVLQIISGNIQMLLYGGGTKEQHEKRLHDVMGAVDKAANLSSQLLAFARRQPLQPRVVNVCTLLGAMDDMVRRVLGAEITVETMVIDSRCNTLVDPNQLENVILNLVINARDAMNGRGTLTIEVDHVEMGNDDVEPFPDLLPGHYVLLAISDTGVGMNADVMAQAFEPFFTTKPVGEGTGLGLSMVYGFVKQSGGHIKIYSEIGQGTSVKIYLPSSNELEQHTSGPAPKDVVIGGNETILLVEDDLDIQSSVGDMLLELGYHVVTANDGASALGILNRGAAIDLLFTDVVMPGPVSSTALVEQAKRIAPQIAVLFTSGYTQNAIVHGGRLDPGVHLLSKPYHRDQMARMVRQILDQRTTARA
ncbi:CHASE domain-containing protein [Noviherbaspirillum saxi]|nr:CHASE domain-containing protein [Noviherbaspirillum saxi]